MSTKCSLYLLMNPSSTIIQKPQTKDFKTFFFSGQKSIQFLCKTHKFVCWTCTQGCFLPRLVIFFFSSTNWSSCCYIVQQVAWHNTYMPVGKQNETEKLKVYIPALQKLQWPFGNQLVAHSVSVLNEQRSHVSSFLSREKISRVSLVSFQQS